MPLDGMPSEELLRLAASVDQMSAHVLADALGLLASNQRLAAQVLPQSGKATLWAD